MMQTAIALLFAVSGLCALAVVGQSLRRAWRAAMVLRAELARCDQSATVAWRDRVVERRAAPVVGRISPAATRRQATAPCALPVAA